MRVALLLAIVAVPLGAAPALAQGMDPSMHGMNMPTATARPAAKPTQKAATRGKPRHVRRRKHAHIIHGSHPSPSRSHADQDMSSMPGMTMAPTERASGASHDKPAAVGTGTGGQDMAGMPGMATPPAAGNNQGMDGMPGMQGMDMLSRPPAAGAPPAEPDAGHATAPPIPTDHAADGLFDPGAMAAARAQLHREHGGGSTYMVLANLAEYQSGNGGGYRWEGEAWYGGDINRFVVKTEGEGSGRNGVGAAEAQALYSRAISPYFNLQGGLRYDIRPTPNRAYATVGFEGLAPEWFEVSGALFLSNKGELLGRLEGYYDQRITQRLILQPRVEANFAAQNVSETGTGSGVSNLEMGLRLRYEVKREFAPYIGVSFDRKFGVTADYARARGEAPSATSFVVGVRAWF
jgi:copper resistance protein B